MLIPRGKYYETTWLGSYIVYKFVFSQIEVVLSERTTKLVVK